MKVTEDHKKQIQFALRARGNNPVHKYKFDEGAEWAIEKFGGIQWNEYPETKPQLTGEYLVMHKDEGLCLVSASKKSQFGLEGLRITHFEFVNLPNE